MIKELITHALNVMQDHGCSAFFFTSAIQSGIFGEAGRRNQAKLTTNNLEFRERLQEIKEEFQRERIDNQLQFRRESYELSRQYMLLQSTQVNENRQREIEFRDFLDNYWPLNYSPYSVIIEQKKLLQHSIVPLRVIIAKTEVTSFDRNRRDGSYDEFCRRLKRDLQHLCNISIDIRPWKNLSNSSISEAMNINYIMQGIPTLIVFPYQIGDTFGIELSAWSFMSGNRSLLHSKVLSVGGFKGIEALESTYSAVRSIIGMTRDAYILSEYRLPICFPEIAKTDKAMLPETYMMLNQHYEKLQKMVADSDEFKSLCTQSEIDKIHQSLDTTKLIEG